MSLAGRLGVVTHARPGTARRAEGGKGPSSEARHTATGLAQPAGHRSMRSLPVAHTSTGPGTHEAKAKGRVPPASATTSPSPSSCSRRGVLLAGAAGGACQGAAPAAQALSTSPAGSIIRKRSLSLEDQMEQRTSEFVLPNGLRFLVHERHAAPIVSCRTYAAVGAFDEEDGTTGIAHLLEHMAFKGTTRIGTRNYAREAPLLTAMDEVFYDLRSLQEAAPSASGKVAALTDKLGKLQEEARQYQIPNHFGAILEQEGAVGLNASTTQDSTQYFVNLPANKLELWMAMEAARFQAPVFRELYSEKKVVLEERSARIEQAPLGRYIEAFQSRAFGNNYRRPTIGYEKDIKSIGRLELQDFFQRHYSPEALTIAIVGDVDPDKVHNLAERYFGSWRAPTSVVPPSSVCREDSPLAAPAGPLPDQRAELWWRSDAGPLVMDGYYHRQPTMCSMTDSVGLSVLSDILYSTRSSRLYRSLVEPGKALSCSVLDSYPGEKFPGMAVTYVVPAPGVDVLESAESVRAEVNALVEGNISATELARMKKGFRVDALRALSENSALASILASSQGLAGDWRRAATELAVLDNLTVADLQRTAADLFRPENRFSGFVLPAGYDLPPGKTFAN